MVLDLIWSLTNKSEPGGLCLNIISFSSFETEIYGRRQTEKEKAHRVGETFCDPDGRYPGVRASDFSLLRGRAGRTREEEDVVSKFILCLDLSPWTQGCPKQWWFH